MVLKSCQKWRAKLSPICGRHLKKLSWGPRACNQTTFKVRPTSTVLESEHSCLIDSESRFHALRIFSANEIDHGKVLSVRGSKLKSGYSLAVGIACSGRILLQSFSLMRLTPLHQSETKPPERSWLGNKSEGQFFFSAHCFRSTNDFISVAKIHGSRDPETILGI